MQIEYAKDFFSNDFNITICLTEQGGMFGVLSADEFVNSPYSYSGLYKNDDGAIEFAFIIEKHFSLQQNGQTAFHGRITPTDNSEDILVLSWYSFTNSEEIVCDSSKKDSGQCTLSSLIPIRGSELIFAKSL